MQRPSNPSSRSLVVAFAFAVVGAFAATGVSACDKDADAARRRSEEATAQAEEQAQEATLTGATIEVKDEAKQSKDDALRARGEMIAAFRLEQSDYRGRIVRALDALDKDIAQARQVRPVGQTGPKRGSAEALRAQRDLLKADLELLERSTEPDWATTRSKLDRDLKGAK